MHEITKTGDLLDQMGNLTEPGFSRKMLSRYDRKMVKGGWMRLKEWDYYLISNGHIAVALTIADNSYMGLDSISFLWLDEAKEKTVSKMQFFTRGKKNLPSTSATGDVKSKGKGYEISFIQKDGKRILDFFMNDFMEHSSIRGKLTLSDEPEESMVIATPFSKNGHFYYNQKINCMRASGAVWVDGEQYNFEPKDSFGVLDWGRGVWTYNNTWYWGSGSGLVDGESFGFNIGYGFGDTKAASENVLFYKGKVHKLSQVTFHIPKDENGAEEYEKPWKFTSDDGRFEMDFVPMLDRKAHMNLGILASDQHQVFGKFTGVAVLDDGQKINLTDFFGFAEKVKNKW